MFTSVRLLATKGTKLVSAMANGTQIDANAAIERVTRALKFKR